MNYAGILSSRASPDARIKRDIADVKTVVSAVRQLGQKIVLTSGSWDLLHTGHAEYLRAAREFGTFLVVGVDSDAKIKKRKGPNRPMVGEDERMLMLSHLRYVDLIYLKDVDEKKHQLIEAVRPDVLVVSETSNHSDQKLAEMREFCKELQILEAKSEKGTTARLRTMMHGGLDKLAARLVAELPKLVHETLHDASEKKEDDA